MKHMKHILLACAVLGHTQLAIADDAIMREAPGSTATGVVVSPSVTAGFERFHYEETGALPSTGAEGVLDQHTALLPTVTLAAEASAFGGHLFARGELSLTGGSMDYEGATQQGMPVTGPTSGLMTHELLVIGGKGRIGSHVRLGGYVGFDHRTWDRDLRPMGPILGYREQYAWSSLPVGVVLEYAPTPRIALTVDAAILYPHWFGNLHLTDMHTTDGRAFDALDLNTTTDYGGRIRASAAYALTHELRVLVSLGLEEDGNDLGPAAELRISGQPLYDQFGNPLALHEPFSTTTRITANVGAGYTF
jgi:hypothetical protein